MKSIERIEGVFHRLWWIPLITGLLCLGFGIWCIFSPMTSLPVFAYIFAGLLCLGGILELCYAYANCSAGLNWGWSMALGILDLLCGVWLFTLPEPLLTVVFMYAVGIWIIIACINAICESAMLAAHSPGWMVWMVLLLVGAIAFGAYFLSSPIAGGVAVWLWIGLSLIFFGGYRIGLAFQIRQLNRKLRI